MFNLYQPVQPAIGDARTGLCYREFEPHPLLSEFILCYWTLSSSGKNGDFRYKGIPDGCVDIFFNSNDFLSPLLVGIVKEPRYGRRQGIINFFGVRFLPGQIQKFFDMPLNGIYDRAVSFREICRNDFIQIEEKIYSADSIAWKINILNQYFITKAGCIKKTIPNDFTYCLNRIYLTGGNISVEVLAKEILITPRHLRRIFNNETGISPKQFIKVVRFQNTLKQLSLSNYSGLHSALANGFYDQSHFYKDFKTLYGSIPSTI